MARPNSDRVSQFVAPALRHAFGRTEIEVTVNGVVMSAAELAKRSGKSVFVVTAHSPRSERLSDAEDDECFRQLENELRGSDRLYWPAVGSDPLVGWSEDWFAIIGIVRSDAERYCRAFDQLAYFEITAKKQIVHGVYSGWSLGRSHSTQRSPIGANTLPMAAANHGDVTVNSSLEQFHYPGWGHIAACDQLCAHCDSAAHLYATIHQQQQQGGIEEHLALVCHQCGWVVAATQLRAEQTRLLELWYDYQVALLDGSQGHEITTDLAKFPDEMSARTYEAYSDAKRQATDPTGNGAGSTIVHAGGLALALFKIGDYELGPFRPVPTGSELYDKELEDLLWSNLEAFVGVQLFPVARHPTLGDGLRPDIVALDADGHVHVIEVKRDVDHKQLGQCLEYAGWAHGTNLSELASMFHAGAEAFFEAWDAFNGTDAPRLVRRPPQIVLVGRDFDARTDAALSYLIENDLAITVLRATVYEDQEGRRIVNVGGDHDLERPASAMANKDVQASPASYKIKGRTVKVRHLIEAELLPVGTTLVWTRPRIGVSYRARVLSTGKLEFDDGRTFDSPSTAARQAAGQACNGWYAWRTNAGESLAKLRARLIAR